MRYIEVQFRRGDKPDQVKRQVLGGFEFEESDPPTRAIELDSELSTKSRTTA